MTTERAAPHHNLDIALQLLETELDRLTRDHSADRDDPTCGDCEHAYHVAQEIARIERGDLSPLTAATALRATQRELESLAWYGVTRPCYSHLCTLRWGHAGSHNRQRVAPHA